MSIRARKHVGAHSGRRNTSLRRDVQEAIDRIWPDGIVEISFDPDESYFFEIHSKLSRALRRITTTIKRCPDASPLLFGKYLMNMAAFVSLEDISEALPPYAEEVISVDMDPALRDAYAKLESDISDALRQHHGNSSVISIGMNALLLYPDRPRGLGTLYGYATNEGGERERFVISEPPDLDENFIYAKERRLIEEVKKELAIGRKVQMFAVYTRKRDVTRRLQQLLLNEGIRCEILTAEIPPEQRETWYERKLQQGMQVCISHPRLVSTGLDYVEYEFVPALTLYAETSSVTVRRITLGSPSGPRQAGSCVKECGRRRGG